MKDNLMVQQQVKSVWQHMVGVICLNQTGRKKVKKVLPNFFSKFPRPDVLLESNRDTIASMIKTLGMHNVKAQRIWRMSEDYLRWDGDDATKLHGIGKYGRVLGELFVKGHEKSVNELLKENGHAYEYDGGKKKKFVAEIQTEKDAKKEDLVDKPAEE